MQEHRSPLCSNATAVVESISDGVFTVDMGFTITSFNRAAQRITGLSLQEVLGRRCYEVLDTSLCKESCVFKETLRCQRSLTGRSAFFRVGGSREIPVLISTALLRDEGGELLGMAESFQDRTDQVNLRRELEGTLQVGQIVTKSPAMRRVLDVLPQIALSRSAVCIHGETGTGKELLAREIHLLSRRRSHAFVPVNCGALPDTLLESELFGYKRGAFTGADRDKRGLLELAHEGTLFLDEIGDISPAFQVKLLRVLQEGTFLPLGGVTERKVDLRLISATNRHLPEEVAQGRFREDLFYRINVVPVELPPLSQRTEDIPLLLEHFIAKYNLRNDRGVVGVEPSVLTRLFDYAWPGNVRELENAVERAFVLSTGNTLLESHFVGIGGETQGGERMASFAQQVAEAKRRILTSALAQHKTLGATATALGIHRSTLYRTMRELQIEP